MNQKKFAELTGYSESTISKVFYGSAEINEETKKSIIDKAKELGIYDKFVKIKKKEKVVAIIVPELKSMFYNRYVDKLIEIIRSKGAISNISTTNFDDNYTTRLIDYYANSNFFDGIILIGGANVKNKKPNIPICAIFAKENKFFDTVYNNVENAICDAICTLKQHGHKRIAFIGEQLTTTKDKYFINALKQNNLPFYDEYMLKSNFRFEAAGEDCMSKILSMPIKPTAILAAYDNIAMGAIKVIKQNGYSVPNDFSIIGMDDIPSSSYHDISLSSIRSDIDNTCSLAVENLFNKINNPDFTKTSHTEIISDFIKRNSIAVAKE